MHKHIIYISNSKNNDILSSYLAHAFAKYRYDNGQTTFLVQRGLNNNPLLIVSDSDTLQVFLTNINANAVSSPEIDFKLQNLIKSLIADGFSSQKCTIKLYTLENELANNLNKNIKYSEFDIASIFANEIVKYFPLAEYTIEWHTIKKSYKDIEQNKSEELVQKIFNSNITFNKVILTGKDNNNKDLKYRNIQNYYPGYDFEKIH